MEKVLKNVTSDNKPSLKSFSTYLHSSGLRCESEAICCEKASDIRVSLRRICTSLNCFVLLTAHSAVWSYFMSTNNKYVIILRWFEVQYFYAEIFLNWVCICHRTLNKLPLYCVNIIESGICFSMGESEVFYVLVLVHI
jgi:hypothetical protein